MGDMHKHHFARPSFMHQFPHLPHQLEQQWLTWSCCAAHEIYCKLTVTNNGNFVAVIKTRLSYQPAQAIYQPLSLFCIVSDPLQTIKPTLSPQAAAPCVPSDEPSRTLLPTSQLPAPPIEL